MVFLIMNDYKRIDSFDVRMRQTKLTCVCMCVWNAHLYWKHFGVLCGIAAPMHTIKS